MSKSKDSLHPELEKKVQMILSAMDTLGFPMRVTQGVRTAEEQAELFAQGRTKPGKIVTNCDGVLKRSRHQVASDGWGHAVDCAFLTNGMPDWSLSLPWRLYGEMGKALGLTWGGDWKTLVDRPHLEMV